jgi:arginase family enzyme
VQIPPERARPSPKELSRLRARCPDCRTLTAVAVGADYECHSCGRVFHAGLVRVPRAWGKGGQAMVEAASLPLPYPETAVVDEDTLGTQSAGLASGLPERPLVLGGCCCAHVGAVEGLGARVGRLSVVWLDAHGDLNTPETSPSGNEWGMPLRMLIDAGAVAAEDVALVGARNLDPPEEAFLETSGLHVGPAGIERAVAGTEATYVALDVDVLDPAHIVPFMPEPDGLGLGEAERMLAELAVTANVVGVGLSGLRPEPRNLAPLGRLLAALRL